MSKKANKAEVFKSDKDDQYYWHIKAANGETLCHSEGYTTKQNALNGLQSLVNNIQHSI